jgi:adenylate kinase family enzyme
VGNSGSGKTTLAAEITERLGCDHIELDGIHHLADWTPIGRDQMREIVADRIRAESWVVDGNYGSLVQDLVFAAADTVVWLDLPRWIVMWRVVRRTVGRMLLRRELWNGNRERPRNLINRDPEENIVLWAWTQHAQYRAQYASAAADPANRHLTWVRLTSPRRQREWLQQLGRSTPTR